RARRPDRRGCRWASRVERAELRRRSKSFSLSLSPRLQPERPGSPPAEKQKVSAVLRPPVNCRSASDCRGLVAPGLRRRRGCQGGAAAPKVAASRQARGRECDLESASCSRLLRDRAGRMTEEGERTALRAGLDFIVPVWGAEYTRCFVDLCLPSFLAPGNIPAMPLAERHVFRIYTTTADRATIEASPAFRLLARHIRVEFHRVRVRDPLRNVNRFSVQSDCYRRAIREADAADRAMVFVTPDML